MHGDHVLLSQQSNLHVDSVDGNGIKVYRILDASSDPGAFAEGSDKYQHLTNITQQLIIEGDSEQNEFESYIDIEPATGLGVRSKIRYGVSHSIWECDPESNEHCKLARYSDASGKCYDSVGAFTYPCSASNILTPDVIGGKIVPTYWFEDQKQNVDNTDTAIWTKLALDVRELHFIYSNLVCYGVILAFLFGLPMMMMVGCFATKREYLNHGSLDGNKAQVTSSWASSQKSMAGSTASAAE
jgi:hypothetical protein